MNMVDKVLQHQDRRLRSLFVDFNSYFASVEQQENPELRGKPIIVVPVDTDFTTAIASSFPAKKLGIKCGTSVREAKEKCKELVVVPARPRIYKAYHEAIREVLQTVIPEEKVHSIDEMSYGLIGDERQPENAIAIAKEMKRRVAEKIGSCITASIGISPNQFISKMATELQKPDGLVLLEAKDLPGPFLNLKLTDFCGINRRMAIRLNVAGIFTVADLYSASAQELRAAFGSIVGDRWWYLLRGFQVEEKVSPQKSVSHSHVLAPEARSDERAKEVLLRLTLKAAQRLREGHLVTSRVRFAAKGKTDRWEKEMAVPPNCDSVLLSSLMDQAWATKPGFAAMQVSVVLSHLSEENEATPSLFTANEETTALSKTLDVVNKKFGKNSVYPAAMEHAKNSADEKIAFQKTWLLCEGKGDNDWKETFRGLTRDL